jgi:HEAT repeat protein
VAIYRSFLDDDQWYVRSAAQQAFQELTYGRAVSLTAPYPEPEDIPWLKNWAQRKGEKMATVDGGRKLLLAALQEGEAPFRILAASNLGQLGMLEAMRSLYNALRDGREEVRTTAHRALAELQLQMDEPLPSPL